MSSQILALDSPGRRVLMLGNLAIARGAIEAGVRVAASYPGTPSSEIMGSLCQVAPQLGIHAEWSTNEKVAYEVAFAASLSGLRSLVSCKHLGVNWISDALLVSAYTGVNGGLVLVVADDVQPYSSQNAEDTRYYAKLAKIPCLEPSNVQEAKDIMRHAFELSEAVQLPVMVRVTTRISHSRGDVRLGPIPKPNKTGHFERDPERYVTIAPNARRRHPWLNRQYERAAELAEGFPLNKLELKGGAKVGVIACGLSYEYVKEAVKILNADEKVSVLKIATSNPLPSKLIERFLNAVDDALVVEEIEPVVETGVRAIAQIHRIDIPIFGRLTGDMPKEFELTPSIVVKAISKMLGVEASPSPLSGDVEEVKKLAFRRIPFLCAGCPHRASYYAIKRALKLVRKGGIVTGDRGCYNQGVHPPLKAIDTCVCMGASISMACGFYKAGVDEPVVAVIGDSTFFHAGIPPLINAVVNKAKITVVVLDNGWTAMTGFQPDPSTGLTATGEPTKTLKVEDIVTACGVEFVKVVDPYDVKEAVNAMIEAINYPEVSVVVFRHACALQELRERRRLGIKPVRYFVDQEACTDCRVCLTQLGCPAMIVEGGRVAIDPYGCVGCGVCAQVCPVGAIKREGS